MLTRHRPGDRSAAEEIPRSAEARRGGAQTLEQYLERRKRIRAILEIYGRQ